MTKEEQIQNSTSIINVFKNKFATKINPVYVNTLQKEVNFREVSVNEQKSLAKVAIENEQRKDIIYDAQCSLINRLCVEDTTAMREEAKELAESEALKAAEEKNIKPDDLKFSGFVQNFVNEYVKKYMLDHAFDVYKLTEFDRIRLLVEIYKNNYFKREIKYKCAACGKENSYYLDFQRISDKFNEFDLTDKTYTVEDSNNIYNFVLNFPSVRSVSQFFKTYMKKYKGLTQKEIDIMNDLGNAEYINLYIKQIELIDKSTGEKNVADFTIMSYSDIEKLIELFPQNVIFSDDTGVLQYIAKEFINKMNSVFQYEKCAFCGEETKEGLGSVIDFFS